MAASELPEELANFLPRNLIPERYEVTIQNNIDDSVPNYSGNVRIKVNCLSETKIIQIHVGGNLDLKMETIKIRSLPNNGDRQFHIEQNNYLSGGRREFILDANLEEGNAYEIEFKFSNDFVITSTGYIHKTYQKNGNANTEKLRRMAFTKLNEFDARRVIPCLDEMHFKAKFKMWLIHPKRLKAFSNAALKSSEDITINGEDWVEDEFHETEDMATFSLAMALAQFQTTGFDNSVIVNVRTWADEDVIEKMVQINQFASKSFEFFSKFFKKEHPLGKLDILILPEVDFEVEESFGLIYMSQKYVLDVLEKSSNTKTFAMVSKICHAVSYQWIGSTVTMSKWEDTWLHQGLNYFLQEECAKEIFPQYSHGILELNMIKSFSDFMRSEEIAVYDESISLLKSYPDIKFLNFVTLEKVKHLIRMIHFILGPDLFESSLVNYVDSFRCLNSNLENALNEFTRKAHSAEPKILPDFVVISDVIESWLHKTGIPLIIIKRNHEDRDITVTQIIFDNLELEPDTMNSIQKTWLIPLSCTTQAELKFDPVRPIAWSEDRFPMSWAPDGDLSENQWVLCNLEFNVPGRVLYVDNNNWRLIQEFLLDKEKFKQINVLTRARIVSDMFTLAEAGKLRYETVFETMKYLHNEEDAAPWIVALTEFDRIRSRLLGSRLYLLEWYQKFVRAILEPVIEKRIVTNFPSNPTENDLEGHFQVLFIEISCKFHIRACEEKSLELLNRWETTFRQTEPEMLDRIQKVVWCEHIKHGSKDQWNAFWRRLTTQEQYQSSTYVLLLQALACSQNSKTLNELLIRSITNTNMSENDTLIIFQALSSNKNGYKLMKKFYRKYYKKINAFRSSQYPYLRILLDASNRRKHYSKIVRFAISKEIAMNDELTNRSLNNATRNNKWVHKNKVELKNILRA